VRTLNAGKLALIVCYDKGHWFCVVVQRHGTTLEGVIADSADNRYRLGDGLVCDLIKIVTFVL
jgi:hypothetical protein